jgi:hypothetical protein
MYIDKSGKASLFIPRQNKNVFATKISEGIILKVK